MATRKSTHTFRDILMRRTVGGQDVNLTQITRELFQGPSLGKSSTPCSWSQMSTVKSIYQNFIRSPSGERLKKLFLDANEQLNIIAVHFGKQCNAIAAQRIRRGTQIANFYSRIYDRNTARKVVSKCEIITAKKPVSFLLGTVLFAWDRHKFSDEDINSATDELTSLGRHEEIPPKDQLGLALGGDWQQLIDRDHLAAWRKPIPNSYLYEYKVYGSFEDIPARAFFDVQVNLEYRKQWDKLIIDLNIVDKDQGSGTEVIQWITHFPYPMYSREYVFARKYMIDQEQNVMVFMSQDTEHPNCPVVDKYVRVNRYKSNMIIRPHTKFDENGFDYVLTYYDDPQAAIPSPAVKWMATKGVPDFVDKLHRAAKVLHKSSQTAKSTSEDDSTSENEGLPM